MTTATTYIPTIRLSSDDDDHETTVAAVRKACLESGFFYVSGHGIDTDALLEQMRRFFALPLPEKRAVADATLSRGYTAMREETLDPSNQTTGDTKEGFYISTLDISQDDPRYNPSKLAGPNQWPDSIKCPSLQDPDTFKRVMLEYLKQILPLALTISRLIAESLTLPADYFDDVLAHEPLASLRLLHYEETQSDTATGVYACGAHSDYGMITVLWTDENDGLQIFDKRGCQEWVSVPSIPGCLVVNLGDMLERWTNGMYCSTLHRVINTTRRERYSAPFFLEPAFDTVVQCLDVCCSAENPARYPPTTSGEHLLSKYRQTHADFTPL
jgi:isopenicillin N synthase-like dioxygenase